MGREKGGRGWERKEGKTVSTWKNLQKERCEAEGRRERRGKRRRKRKRKTEGEEEDGEH